MGFRVQVPNNWVVRIWLIVIAVQVLCKYMVNGYLDPYGTSAVTSCSI